MARLDPRQIRDRARVAFEETVNLALTELTDHERVCLLAAAGSWARAERAAAVAEFVEARTLERRADAESLAPN